MERIQKVCNQVFTIISAILVLTMITVVVANVINRYCFNSAFIWSAEFSSYCTIWAVMIGATALIWNDKHLAITVLAYSLKGLAKLINNVAKRVLTIVFLIIFVYSGYELFNTTVNQTASTMRTIPMNLFYIIMPISGALMLFGTIFQLINDIVGYCKGRKEND